MTATLRALIVLSFFFLPTAGITAENQTDTTPKPLSRADVYQLMEQTLYNIRDAFKEAKPEFPQLADIDAATIKKDGLQDGGRVRFDYERGVVKENFTEEVTFKKDGCDIVVQIKYPATQEDVDMRRLKGTLFSLQNGDSYAVWYLVRAENNGPGNIFKSKADEIISSRLNAMRKTLE